MAYYCLNHPERDAVGVCVKCRKYVCAECATRIEGVNYCADCLPQVGRRKAGRSRSWEKPVSLLITLSCLAVCSVLLGTCALLLPEARPNIPDEAKWDRNFERMETVVEALLEFREDCGRFPADEEGLDALLSSPGMSDWDGPYVESHMASVYYGIEDEYGNKIAYRIDGLAEPVIVSAGKDGYFQTNIKTLIDGESGEGDDELFWVK